jgi:hypothetical protein
MYASARVRCEPPLWFLEWSAGNAVCLMQHLRHKNPSKLLEVGIAIVLYND